MHLESMPTMTPVSVEINNKMNYGRCCVKYSESSNLPPITRRNMLGVMGGVVSGISLLDGFAQGQTTPVETASAGGSEKEKAASQASGPQTGSDSQAPRVQISPKWIRVYLGGGAVASSRRVLMLFDGRVPVYYFPEKDVRMDLMTSTTHHTNSVIMGEASYYTLKTGGKVAENAVWYYPKPPAAGAGTSRIPDLRGYVAFDWKMMDAWYEEGEEVFGHAHDPAHRIDALHSSRQVRVVMGGTTVAESRQPVMLFETGFPTRYYIPKEDVRQELLRLSNKTSLCAYKGEANYYSVDAGGKLFSDVAWYYRYPAAEVGKIANNIAFYSENADVTLFVDGKELPKIQRIQANSS